jgi:hypothetical protein
MGESRGKRPRGVQPQPSPALTSEELRADPVPVQPTGDAAHVIVDSMPAISVTALTDAELRASPLDVNLFSQGAAIDVNVVTGGGGGGGGLTDAELRATPLDVTLFSQGGAVGVTVTNWPGTQPVSGPLTDTQLRATPVPVSGPLTDTQLRATVLPVSGPLTDGQLRAAAVPVSGPLTDAQLRALGVPVTGTFWQATQPVSGPLTDAQLRAAAVPVSGAFFQATQPVSAAALPLPAGASTEATLAALSAKIPASLGQKAMAAALAVVLASDQSAIPTTKVPTGGTNVLKTGTITTVAVTADQVVLTYTVTAGKTFYLCYLVMYGRLTAVSATASIIGAISLESPAGTKLITFDDVNPTTSEPDFHPLMFGEPIPIAAGVVIRIVVTPAAATSMLWRGNFGGYEK